MDFASDYSADERDAERALSGTWTSRATDASNAFSAHVLLKRQLHDSAHGVECQCEKRKEHLKNFGRAFEMEAYLWDRALRGKRRCSHCGEELACDMDEAHPECIENERSGQ